RKRKRHRKRQFSDRRRIKSSGRAQRVPDARRKNAVTTTDTDTKGETFIERLIDRSARDKFLVFVFTIFAVAAGIYGVLHTPLDPIPDLSDVQVIVYTDWEGRSPDLVEDQITYPISSVFIAAPKVKFVRGESMFGKSFVYVIFQDGTDIYWARSRVIEYL